VIFHRQYDVAEGRDHVTVEAWTREDLVSAELIEKANPAFIRVDRENGVLVFMVENGVATYRMGVPRWPSVEIPIFLQVASGAAPIVEGRT
jgi:hypothetical protein